MIRGRASLFPYRTAICAVNRTRLSPWLFSPFKQIEKNGGSSVLYFEQIIGYFTNENDTP
jgi:hypothetical protein